MRTAPRRSAVKSSDTAWGRGTAIAHSLHVTRSDVVGIVGLAVIGIGSLVSCGGQAAATSRTGAGAAQGRDDSGAGGSFGSGHTDSGKGGADANGLGTGGKSSNSGPTRTAYICNGTPLRISANDPLLTDFEDTGAIDLGYSVDSDGLRISFSGSTDTGGGSVVGSPGYASAHALQVTGSRVTRWISASVWWLSSDAKQRIVQCADATAFDGISFWVRGTPGTAELELATPSTLTVLQGGICSGVCRVHRQVQVSSEWALVETKWSEFLLDGVDSASPAQIVGLSLSLQPLANDAGTVELMLDDVRFLPRTASSADIDAGPARSSNGGADAGAITPFAGCPPAPPAPASPCTPPWTPPSDSRGVFAHCSWGDYPSTSGRATATCDAGSWRVAWQGWQPVPPDPPPGCPATPPPDQQVCDPSSDPGACVYRGTSCGCGFQCKYPSPTGFCSAYTVQPLWGCTSPPQGCPADIPQAGTACDTEGLRCSNDCNLDIVCHGGVWEWLNGYCPTCASPDTPIATPTGDRPIAELSEGDLVYSVERGAVVAVPIVRVTRTPVHGHHVIRVQLVSGETLEISAGHPTADGRTFGSLKTGERMDALHKVASVATVPYLHDATYDILPASSTGTYFAAGVEIGSTLIDTRAEVQQAADLAASSRRKDQ